MVSWACVSHCLSSQAICFDLKTHLVNAYVDNMNIEELIQLVRKLVQCHCQLAFGPCEKQLYHIDEREYTVKIAREDDMI